MYTRLLIFSQTLNLPVVLLQKQRQIPSEKDVAMHALPRDFIEQQRAYFAEIDAFELPEEEVESVEELD